MYNQQQQQQQQFYFSSPQPNVSNSVMMHDPFSNTVTMTTSGNTLLHSRDAVLKFVKQSLQVFYDAGTITRVQYVDICKSILYNTMNTPYGSPSWTPQYLTQQIAQRVSEYSTAMPGSRFGDFYQQHGDGNKNSNHNNTSAVAAAATATTTTTSLTTIANSSSNSNNINTSALSFSPMHNENGNNHHRAAQSIPPLAPPSPSVVQHQQQHHQSTSSSSPSSTSFINAFAIMWQASFLLQEVESSERRCIIENEETQNFLTKQLLSWTAHVSTSASSQRMVSVPLSAIQEQQVALRQLMMLSSGSITGPPSSSSLHGGGVGTPVSQQQQQRLGNVVSAASTPTATSSSSTLKRSTSPSAVMAMMMMAGQRRTSSSNGGGGGSIKNRTGNKTPGSVTKQQLLRHPFTKQEVVEFMRQILQPSYNAGLLPAEQFAEIVRDVSTQLFSLKPREDFTADGLIALLDHEGYEQHVHWKVFVRDKIANFFSSPAES